MNTQEENSIPSLLLRALRWACKPLVRLLIEKGITYPVLSDTFKTLYIETSQEMLEEKGIPPTLSRVFVQTGIHRKEAKRILEEVLSQQETTNESTSLGALLVARWMGLEKFTDKEGNPLPLDRTPGDSGVSFNDLVQSVNKDVHPRSILNEWLDLDVVSINDNNQVVLNQNAFVPSKGLQDKLFFFGRHIGDHLETCVDNILETKPGKLERSVYYSALSVETVKKLQQLADEKANETLNLLNKEALALKQSQSPDQDNEHRIRFGVYWYDNMGNDTSANDGGDDNTGKHVTDKDKVQEDKS